MFLRKFAPCATAIALALLVFSWGGFAVADTITYTVTADTSSASPSTGGAIDCQFNTNASGVDTATISSLRGGTPLVDSNLYNSGGATGNLTMLPFTITDSAALPTTNELFQSFNYGASLSFSVTFNFTPTSQGAAFALQMVDGSGNFIDPIVPNSLGGGPSLILNFLPGGTPDPLNGSDTYTGAGLEATAYSGPVATPEPSSFTLLAGFFLSFVGYKVLGCNSGRLCLSARRIPWPGVRH